VANNQFDQIIVAAAVNYEVSVPLIRAVIMTESSFNPNAYRPEPAISDGSYGLMQVLFRTAVSLGFPNDPSQHTRLFDPATNINLGTKYLAQLQRKYENVDDIYAAYNSGAVRKNAAGEYVNTKGDNAVQKRVDRFLGIYTDMVAEWEAARSEIKTTEAETEGSAEPAGIATLLLVIVAGYLTWRYFA